MYVERRYSSAQVCAQTQVHSLFLSFPTTVGQLPDMTSESRRRTDDFTSSSKHEDETPPTSQLQALTEAY
ncbi:unnamed protein product, partial [Brenthis ino]